MPMLAYHTRSGDAVEEEPGSSRVWAIKRSESQLASKFTLQFITARLGAAREFQLNA